MKDVLDAIKTELDELIARVEVLATAVGLNDQDLGV